MRTRLAWPAAVGAVIVSLLVTITSSAGAIAIGRDFFRMQGEPDPGSGLIVLGETVILLVAVLMLVGSVLLISLAAIAFIFARRGEFTLSKFLTIANCGAAVWTAVFPVSGFPSLVEPTLVVLSILSAVVMWYSPTRVRPC